MKFSENLIAALTQLYGHEYSPFDLPVIHSAIKADKKAKRKLKARKTKLKMIASHASRINHQ